MLGVNVIMVNGVTVGPNAAVQALREGLGRVLEAGAQVWQSYQTYHKCSERKSNNKCQSTNLITVLYNIYEWPLIGKKLGQGLVYK